VLKLIAYISFLLFVFSTGRVSAQRVGIGEWDSYFTLTNMYDIVEADKKVVWVSELSALYYDLEDLTVNELNKIDGLTQTGFTSVAYEPVTKSIVFGYNNGNIDLVVFDENNKPVITNMSDIKNATLTGDKKIYNLYTYEKCVYVSCGFGIVVIDLEKKEVKDTYIIGAGASQIKINGVCIGNDTIYATSDDGIYKAYRYSPFLNYYASWSKMTSLPVWLLSKSFKQPAYGNNRLYIIPDYPGYGQDTSYYREGGVWYKTPALQGLDCNAITPMADGNIVMATRENISRFTPAFSVLGEIFTYNGTNGLVLNKGLFGSDGSFFIADEYKGPMMGNNSYGMTSLLPGGTATSSVRRVTIYEDQLWVSAGHVEGTIFYNTYNTDFFSIKEGNDWFYINEVTDPILNNGAYDAMDVAVDPTDPTHVMAATWAFQGLVEIQNKVVTNLYDETNTILFSPPSYPGFCGVSSVVYDDDGNLWCLNGKSNNPLVVKMKDGNWQSFYCGPEASARTYFDLVIDQNGYKYIPYPTLGATAGGLVVYNDNGTFMDKTDDAYYTYKTSSGTGNLPDADVKCVAEDLDGEIWIGTGKGPAVIFNPSSIFNGGAEAAQILIQQDGNTQILLETEVVNCIEVDGANRKWIGTENSGVYLLSEDGQEEISHFTAENSPLPSNSILDIEINGKTGEVFFATANGLISYRGTATESKKVFEEVHIFPNPVRPGYEGLIAINGLSRNSDVKITDIAGNIVNVIKSEGGQATWNGQNMKGQRVKSGVYMFLCSKEDGSDKIAGKVMFIE
jgi:hypothetical protein